MNIRYHIISLITALALVFLPGAALEASTPIEDAAPNVCMSGNGMYSFSGSSDETAAQIFCGHFMSVEDFPADAGHTDALTSVVACVFQNAPLVGFVGKAQNAVIASVHLPHSLHPEVAPHPPKFSKSM